MPYELHKKGRGYVVKNVATGKEHSKKGISKDKAEAQKRVLEMVEKMKKK